MNIYTFRIQKQTDQGDIILYPTLVEISAKYFLIDCGYEETFPEFTAELDKLGVGPTDLYAILVSHDDIDHIGALTLFKDNHPNLRIYCSELEEPSVSGKVKSERLLQAEQSLSVLPEEHKPWAAQFINQLKSMKRTDVDGRLKHHDKICGEMEVIFTPGHTKGHISFFIPDEKTLIANDALVLDEGRFDLANPGFTLDICQAIQSVKLIKALQPEKIICYHGGISEDHISDKLTELLDKYKDYS